MEINQENHNGAQLAAAALTRLERGLHHTSKTHRFFSSPCCDSHACRSDDLPAVSVIAKIGQGGGGGGYLYCFFGTLKL
jgi:hypothetical protein